MKKIVRLFAVILFTLSVSANCCSSVLAFSPPPQRWEYRDPWRPEPPRPEPYRPVPPRPEPQYSYGYSLPPKEQPPVYGSYILPDSASRYLAESEVSWMDNNTLRLALNEVYARRGRRFNDRYLQNYFDSQPWYRGTIYPDSFRESVFNRYEKANIQMMARIQKIRGTR